MPRRTTLPVIAFAKTCPCPTYVKPSRKPPAAASNALIPSVPTLCLASSKADGVIDHLPILTGTSPGLHAVGAGCKL
jgi:hypothetical protein